MYDRKLHKNGKETKIFMVEKRERKKLKVFISHNSSWNQPIQILAYLNRSVRNANNRKQQRLHTNGKRTCSFNMPFQSLEMSFEKCEYMMYCRRGCDALKNQHICNTKEHRHLFTTVLKCKTVWNRECETTTTPKCSRFVFFSICLKNAEVKMLMLLLFFLFPSLYYLHRFSPFSVSIYVCYCWFVAACFFCIPTHHIFICNCWEHFSRN